MNPSRSFRIWFVGTLAAAIAIVIICTVVCGVHFWPDWREGTVQHALNESRAHAFWWPKSWRVELAVRQEQRETEREQQEIKALVSRAIQLQNETLRGRTRAEKRKPIDRAGP
jgi:hypothetical protein